MAVLKLSSPWVTYYRELNELFKRDEEINVIYDEENSTIKMFVDNATKADALAKLLPTEKKFGNMVLNIEIIPANKLLGARSSDYADAFKGNPAVEEIVTLKLPGLGEYTYIIFENRVVQYFNDDLGDINGLCSTLYQDIAKRVFEDTLGIFFCTGPTLPTLRPY